MFMFKFVNGDVIESIKYMFSINKEIHDHFTRQSNKFRVPKCNKTTIQTNVRFRGVKVWKYICNVVYHDCSWSCFKCTLKECLIHGSPYNQIHSCISSWWRHQMETFSALLALSGIHRSPVNSPYKGQWRGALISSLICTWTNGCVSTRDAGDLRHHRAHCGVTVM